MPAAVLVVAAALRFFALDRPGTLVFDELYYVRDAISQLAHGFPTSWPDSEPGMSGGRATAFLDDPSYAVHPPLGKWLIGIGVLAFGPDNGWGWRSASALFGALTVALVMRLGWHLSKSLIVASIAGLLLALDGVHVTLSRVGLLDGFLTFFVLLGALFVWKGLVASGRIVASAAGPDGRPAAAHPGEPPPAPIRIPITWGRPWLVAAALTFGAAASVKWSGLYPLAAFLILIALRDLASRLRAHERFAVLRSLAQAGVTAVLTLPLTVLVYAASWVGWIVTPGGWGRDPAVPWWSSLLKYHADMLSWHGTLDAPHPYQSNPLTWPLALRPTAMYETRWTDGCPWHECVAAVTPLPNPILTWGGALAICALAWFAARASSTGSISLPTRAATFVVVGFLSGWLPWVLTFSRPAVFQFYAVVLTPFTALALALVFARLCRFGETEPGLEALSRDELGSRRAALGVFLTIALALALWFFPLWSGMPVTDWFFRLHVWLPGWD
ncbi:dolichyl-phosphate-mannose--protein mannosyltransferase [Leucobacter edaphi]|uniref:dolichyl-phosphate-mannose--protein mannosyltransferase n=1 Tax=Leucobacter edaphi TaxID=2796472 RepID=UPI001F44818C|nr:phospholipid carrier-dependent glycosyltransferase [Leucobacter edaphi]